MLLDYTTYVNVSDGHDAVDKIRQFAVSKGWVQQAWYPNQSWIGTGSPYSFGTLAGCCYLCLTSTGYGTTPLIARMGIFPGKVSNSSLGWNYYYCAMANSTNIDYTTAYYPYVQNCITAPEVRVVSAYGGAGMDLGQGNITKMWIFGDSKWILAVFNYDGSHVGALHFGQMEMLEANPSQGQCRGFCNMYQGSWTGYYPVKYQYYLNSTIGSTNYIGTPFWQKSVGQTSGYILPSFDIAYADNNAVPYSNQGASTSYTSRIVCNIGSFCATNSVRSYWFASHMQGFEGNPYFPDLGYALNVNTYSNRRILLKGIYAVQSRVDSTFRPVCRSNVYFTRFNGLTIGEELAYGTDRYLVFPFWHISEPLGFAVRVA